LPNANSIWGIYEEKKLAVNMILEPVVLFYPYSEPSLDFVLNAPRGEPYILLLWKFAP
jgi:hypothetical protein